MPSSREWRTTRRWREGKLNLDWKTPLEGEGRFFHASTPHQGPIVHQHTAVHALRYRKPVVRRTAESQARTQQPHKHERDCKSLPVGMYAHGTYIGVYSYAFRVPPYPTRRNKTTRTSRVWRGDLRNWADSLDQSTYVAGDRTIQVYTWSRRIKEKSPNLAGLRRGGSSRGQFTLHVCSYVDQQTITWNT